MQVFLKALFVATLLHVNSAYAEIFSCTAPDGKKVYQDYPCENGSKGESIIRSYEDDRRSSNETGIHGSNSLIDDDDKYAELMRQAALAVGREFAVDDRGLKLLWGRMLNEDNLKTISNRSFYQYAKKSYQDISSDIEKYKQQDRYLASQRSSSATGSSMTGGYSNQVSVATVDVCSETKNHVAQLRAKKGNNYSYNDSRRWNDMVWDACNGTKADKQVAQQRLGKNPSRESSGIAVAAPVQVHSVEPRNFYDSKGNLYSQPPGGGMAVDVKTGRHCPVFGDVVQTDKCR